MKSVQNTVDDYSDANFTEDEPFWDNSSLYNYEDERRDGHYIYKYAGDDNTNTVDNPSVDSLSLVPSWVQVRPSNYYAMLDGKTSTQTENSENITIEVQCNNLDTISLLELEGNSLLISLYDNTTSQEVFTKDFNLIDNSEIVDFKTYCFNDVVLKSSIYFDKIPFYSDATLVINIMNNSSIAKVGRLVLGRSYYYGDTLYSPSLGVESFSHKEVDQFGNVSLAHGNNINIDSYRVQIHTSKTREIRKKLSSLDAIPILFIMDETETSNTNNLLNFGYWDSFNIILNNPIRSTLNISIKGIL